MNIDLFALAVGSLIGGMSGFAAGFACPIFLAVFVVAVAALRKVHGSNLLAERAKAEAEKLRRRAAGEDE